MPYIIMQSRLRFLFVNKQELLNMNTDRKLVKFVSGIEVDQGCPIIMNLRTINEFTNSVEGHSLKIKKLAGRAGSTDDAKRAFARDGNFWGTAKMKIWNK